MFNLDNTREIQSKDANVKKFVFSSSEVVAEAVLYKYPTYEDRTVICCSTQSGCPVGCRFCGAGDAFVRSLTTDEIVFQVVHCLESTKVDPDGIQKLQIMFMSMGEPLLNMKHLVPALRELAVMYPKAALLISTSGPKVDYTGLREISKELPQIGLQFSVHESTNEARNVLVPFKAKLSLQEIAFEGENWHFSTYRKPFFNYCVHENNDKAADIQRLLALFKPDIWEATISVICERDESVSAANERQQSLAAEFTAKMVGAGYSTRMFNPAGQDDIGGGCGQLWYVQKWMSDHPDLAGASIGRNNPVVHMPTV